MQPSDTSRFTKAVVVSRRKNKIKIDRTMNDGFAILPEVTWCGLLFDCFTRASSQAALAYVRQVLPS